MTHSQPTGRKAVFSALKSFAENGLLDATGDQFGQMMVDESDRGLVIILVSIIDDVLAAQLEGRMRDLSSRMRDRIFGFEGPLGTFSSRMKLAYALEVIDYETYQDLDTMRSMRNACAHSRRDISFENEALRKALDLLFEFEDDPSYSLKDCDPQLCKVHFMAATTYTMSRIGGDSKEEASQKSNKVYDEIWKAIREAETSSPSSGGDKPPIRSS